MLTTPPFAPTTIAALQQLGIHNQADLQTMGAVHAFLLLKAAGHTLTRSVLWQLAACAHDTDVRTLSEADKAELLAAMRAHPPVATFPEQAQMEYFMRKALAQAQQSAHLGEVPVGAVVVQNNHIIAAAHNTCVQSHDISRHAEISALAAAGQALGNYRLKDCDVYITLEPCSMCSSALIQARVRRVIFGAHEPKTGAAGSLINLFADTRLNRHTAIRGGILVPECKAVLQAFFQAKR